MIPCDSVVNYVFLKSIALATKLDYKSQLVFMYG